MKGTPFIWRTRKALRSHGVLELHPVPEPQLVARQDAVNSSASSTGPELTFEDQTMTEASMLLGGTNCSRIDPAGSAFSVGGEIYADTVIAAQRPTDSAMLSSDALDRSSVRHIPVTLRFSGEEIRASAANGAPGQTRVDGRMGTVLTWSRRNPLHHRIPVWRVGPHGQRRMWGRYRQQRILMT